MSILYWMTILSCTFLIVVKDYEHPLALKLLMFSFMLVRAHNLNVRSLLTITIALHLIFFELDGITYYLTAWVFATRYVLGDIILNTVICIQFLLFMVAIIHREQIVRIFYPKEYEEFTFVKGDLLMLQYTKFMLLFNIVYLIFLIYLASSIPSIINVREYQDNLAVIRFNYATNFYVEINRILEFTGFIIMAVLVHTWSKYSIDKGRIVLF